MKNLNNVEVINLRTEGGKLIATISYQDPSKADEALTNGYDWIEVPVNLRDLEVSPRGNLLVDQSAKVLDWDPDACAFVEKRIQGPEAPRAGPLPEHIVEGYSDFLAGKEARYEHLRAFYSKRIEALSPPVTANPSKQYKSARNIAKQVMRKGKDIPLTHMLINLRSWETPWYINDLVKKTCLNKSLEWNHGIRNRILDTLRKEFFDGYIDRPSQYKKQYGNRTYYYDGAYHSVSQTSGLPF